MHWTVQTLHPISDLAQPLVTRRAGQARQQRCHAAVALAVVRRVRLSQPARAQPLQAHQRRRTRHRRLRPWALHQGSGLRSRRGSGAPAVTRVSGRRGAGRRGQPRARPRRRACGGRRCAGAAATRGRQRRLAQRARAAQRVQGGVGRALQAGRGRRGRRGPARSRQTVSATELLWPLRLCRCASTKRAKPLPSAATLGGFMVIIIVVVTGVCGALALQYHASDVHASPRRAGPAHRTHRSSTKQ